MTEPITYLEARKYVEFWTSGSDSYRFEESVNRHYMRTQGESVENFFLRVHREMDEPPIVKRLSLLRKFLSIFHWRIVSNGTSS